MATGFTPPTMNWNASDIPDEFNSFKQYCNLVFDGPFLKKTYYIYITMDYILYILYIYYYGLYITMDWATGS